ncbi:MAG: hypothetical protein WCW14_05095 [Candidatus Paceibacterota bacterium]|jgi:hypothetical protein
MSWIDDAKQQAQKEKAEMETTEAARDHANKQRADKELQAFHQSIAPIQQYIEKLFVEVQKQGLLIVKYGEESFWKPGNMLRVFLDYFQVTPSYTESGMSRAYGIKWQILIEDNDVRLPKHLYIFLSTTYPYNIYVSEHSTYLRDIKTLKKEEIESYIKLWLKKIYKNQ